MLVNKNSTQGGYFNYISEEEVRQIHMASLEILERTGVVVYDEEALKLLEEGGAFVDGNRVRIPNCMVKKAIASAPSKIAFCNIDGERRIQLYRNNVYYGLGTDLPSFIDPYTDEIRQTVLKDVENVGKVAQYAENIDFVASAGLASDVDQRVVDLYHLKTIRTYCNKPNWITATDYGNMKALIDMAAVSAGGYEKLRENPTIGLYGEPVSPLINSKEATQKLLLCAEYGIPVTWASGIIAGGTGPVTLAGSLALGNAEGLSGLVIHQLKAPGAPFIFGLVGSTMDMKSQISCYGGAELPIMHAVVGQLARFYELPCYGTGGCSDSNCVDAQAGIESMFSNMMAALSGTNLVHDNAYLGAGLIGNLSMILLNSDIVGCIKRMQEGIKINEETLCLDLIDKVGPGGEYMTKSHTFKHYKEETHYPEYMNRKQHQSWTEAGAKDINQILRAKTIEIIEEDVKPLLNDMVISQYDNIIKRREVEIANGQFHREDF
ncbi:MAG: trimethylamine methyltransferase family protein [Anaerovoracaceae bacterium]